ncbi:hypothetical protein GCM10010123_02600 [Pilimelia anulata]|uniref:DUF4173 domain-containing protein n=1 Tax=Pilimelia anulata TaxID=53371 RepID=A0A8J3F847_9ACTN|nr:DUF4173 domain-containing protein [Pilimelia anulata]GGJ76102.1 hypothetical protein GCM10010123_02600 [Pilimelia anulata]
MPDPRPTGDPADPGPTPPDAPAAPPSTPTPPAAAPASPAAPAPPGAAVPAHPTAPAVQPYPAPVPVPPSFFARRWPAPAAPAGPAALLAIAGAAVGAAIFTPLGGVGIGWPLAGACVLGAVVAVARTGPLDPADRRARLGWSAAALALLSVLAFRNAWWLVAFCVLGALGCTALAIVGGRSIRGIAFGLLGAPLAAVRGLPWLGRTLLAPAGRGGTGGEGVDRRAATVRRVVVATLGTLGVLIVFGGLLASADAAFDELLSRVLPDITAATVFSGGFLLAAGGLIALAGAFTAAAPLDRGGLESPGAPRLGRWEWAAPTGALVLLFAGFVAVQATALFGGRKHLAATAGLSVAEYARGGFWQLAVVTVLTLLVLLAITRWARREDAGDRALLRWLLGPLCLLSLVIVASALGRMYVYQQVYSFTGERIFVMAVEGVLGLVFVLVLVAGLRGDGRWIPRAIVALQVAMLLALAALNPEGYAARRNLDRYERDGVIDLWYVRALSADAAPALAELPADLRRCALGKLPSRLGGPERWYEWNLGRHRARAVLREIRPTLRGESNPCRMAPAYDHPVRRPIGAAAVTGPAAPPADRGR